MPITDIKSYMDGSEIMTTYAVYIWRRNESYIDNPGKCYTVLRRNLPESEKDVPPALPIVNIFTPAFNSLFDCVMRLTEYDFNRHV